MFVNILYFMKFDQKTKELITARAMKAPILMNTPLSGMSGISTAAN